MPPSERAKRFMRPKQLANAAASPFLSSKYVRKCVANWAFMASSVPKQAEYWKIITTTRKSDKHVT
eukprot:9306230-Alexandrium_andersonii.AAC.1